jgi:hypothetical protein
LGRTAVSSAIRVPRPPARITAFISYSLKEQFIAKEKPRQTRQRLSYTRARKMKVVRSFYHLSIIAAAKFQHAHAGRDEKLVNLSQPELVIATKSYPFGGAPRIVFPIPLAPLGIDF